MYNWLSQKGLHPVDIGAITERWFFIVATSHRQQITHGHGLEIVAYLSRQLVGEIVDDLIGQRHLSIGNSQSNGRSGKGLAHRVEYVRHAIGTLTLPTAVDNLAVFDDHHAVDIHRVVGCLLEEGVHGRSQAIGRLCTWQVDDFCRCNHIILAGHQRHQHRSRKETGFLTHSSVVLYIKCV